MTSTVDVKDETRSRPIQKAKVNVFAMAMLMPSKNLFLGLFPYT